MALLRVFSFIRDISALKRNWGAYIQQLKTSCKLGDLGWGSDLDFANSSTRFKGAKQFVFIA